MSVKWGIYTLLAKYANDGDSDAGGKLVQLYKEHLAPAEDRGERLCWAARGSRFL